MTDFPISRRTMLGAIGAAGVAGAALSLHRSSRGSRALGLIDADLDTDDRRLARAMLKGHRSRQLKGDLVWQWRRELGGRLAGGRAIALVRWDKAVMLAGLARESSLTVRQARIGRSLFRVDIG